MCFGICMLYFALLQAAFATASSGPNSVYSFYRSEICIMFSLYFPRPLFSTHATMQSDTINTCSNAVRNKMVLDSTAHLILGVACCV